MAVAQKVAVKAPAKPKSTFRKPDWHVADRPVAYDRALAFMEAKVGMIRDKGDNDYVWLLEHPPVYTSGTSADPKDLLQSRFPVHAAGRGGQYTYHGPGQRVAYVMLDLQKRTPDLKAYIHQLEEWAIETLKTFDVQGERREGRIGIWIDMKNYGRPKGTESKIAAIGVRVKKWVSYHGIAINVNPDLSHYNGIVPCGLSGYGVTSLADLGIKVPMQDMDRALKANWEKVFG
ncbi:MAG: lipoyl(octanoyl) transferase LipB [Alphaproteobacteria bacterium]|nr:MAG: lipoyl(octanoyl) transferase LipB [Alphaproteobacteria bacterium]